jgi:hypothetical protein
MNKRDKEQVVAHINATGAQSGAVHKVSGTWYVNGERVKPVPPPIIKVPHWTDGGASGAIIEGEVR